MSILVLGAGGFIGGHLVSALLASGKKVVVYDRQSALEKIVVDWPNVKCISGDFCKESRWNEIFTDVKLCYHLISTTVPKSSNDDPIADVMGNVVGTLTLLEAARKHNVRIIFASSGGTVYGAINSEMVSEDHPTNPLCSYGITKITIEKYLSLYRELHGVRSTVLRMANPYGEGQQPDSIQGVVAVFMGRALRGHSIDIWGDGSVVRDYVHVHDVVRAMLAASDYGGKTHVFNIGSGRGVALSEVLAMIEKVTGKRVDTVFHPPRGFDVPRNVLNICKSREELSWFPQISMVDGLERTAKWMRRKINEIDGVS